MGLQILLQEDRVTDERLVHEATHDVKSFVWALFYYIMRNIYH
jgi:hypothetical protein